MTTSILSPRVLGPFLKLYGFENASYLAMYLCCFETYANHITGVDEDVMDRTLEDHETMTEFGLTAMVCIGTETGAEAMIIGHDHMSGQLLIVRPGVSDDVSVRGAAVFGPEDLIHHFQDFLGVEISRTSQRPSH